MRPSPRTVLIPMVGQNDRVGCVARIHADDNAPVHNPAALEPRLAELADWQLYEAGSVALGAIRRLQLQRRRWGVLHNVMSSAVPAYVTVTNGPDLVGLSPDSSRSAELGLALAALMFGGQCQSRIAIATGALVRSEGMRFRLVAGAGPAPVAILENAKGEVRRVAPGLSEAAGMALPPGAIRLHLVAAERKDEALERLLAALTDEFRAVGPLPGASALAQLKARTRGPGDNPSHHVGPMVAHTQRINTEENCNVELKLE